MSIEFIPITQENIPAALEIYNWYVVNTTATFHLHPVPQHELERMVSLGHPKYKSFVVVDGDVICGFCYISQFRYKEAYDKSAEVTLYLHKDYRRKGIGINVLTYMEQVAQEQGIKNLVGVITEENVGSVALFEKAGFFKVGHLKKIGEKFGKVLDVVSYQKVI